MSKRNRDSDRPHPDSPPSKRQATPSNVIIIDSDDEVLEPQTPPLETQSSEVEVDLVPDEVFDELDEQVVIAERTSMGERDLTNYFSGQMPSSSFSSARTISSAGSASSFTTLSSTDSHNSFALNATPSLNDSTEPTQENETEKDEEEEEQEEKEAETSEQVEEKEEPQSEERVQTEANTENNSDATAATDNNINNNLDAAINNPNDTNLSVSESKRRKKLILQLTAVGGVALVAVFVALSKLRPDLTFDQLFGAVNQPAIVGSLHDTTALAPLDGTNSPNPQILQQVLSLLSNTAGTIVHSVQEWFESAWNIMEGLTNELNPRGTFESIWNQISGMFPSAAPSQLECPNINCNCLSDQPTNSAG